MPVVFDEQMQELCEPGGPFEIREVTIRGVPTRTWVAAPSTLLEIWASSAAHGDAVFLVYEHDRITYAEAHEQVAAVAAALAQQHGVGQGDRVAIGARNYPEWALAFWAAVTLGAVVVPLNAWWTGSELEYALDHSGAKVLVADHERLERIAPHLGNLSMEALIGIRDEGTAGATPIEQLVAAGRGLTVPTPTIHPDDDVTILYTSGTTGRPKGAVGTHRNICSFLWNGVYARTAAALSAGASLPGTEADDAGGERAPAAPPPSTVLTFPLFHVGGLQSHLVPYTYHGGKLVLMYKWDADEALDLIDREDVVAFSGVPTTAFALLERARERGAPLDSLMGVSSGATLVPPELVRQIDTQFASRVAPANGYGLTETSGAMVFNSGPEYVEVPESVGRPFAPVNEMKIVGEDGEEVPTGEVGEIWLKGPSVVRGYFGDPEATATAFTDGWFHTGDLGRIDETGLLFVVDRLKDMVVRGGENVYAAEVEGALFEHPDVTEAAIVGLPHPTLGEEIGAVVRLRDGAQPDDAALHDHVAERLARFKVPTRWWLRQDELPRNAAGKILKRQLREEMAARGTSSRPR